MLENEKAALLKQVDELQLQVYTLTSQQSIAETVHIEKLQNKIDILQADITRLEFQMMKSKEACAEENNLLRIAIEQTERVAIEAKMQYAEAATDRDIYLKQFHDLKESKKSRFHKIFKRNTKS